LFHKQRKTLTFKLLFHWKIVQQFYETVAGKDYDEG
jgi:hypothetical protein